jgi:DNA-binding transcriptional ArsR family regulator
MASPTHESTQESHNFVVRDYETLKILADPLRVQLAELLMAEALNVRQVAERLGLAPSKLYYHFGLLETIGLIQVVDTRLHKNIVEKTYRSPFTTLTVDPALLNFSTDAGKENINTALLATLDATRDDILRSLQARAQARAQGAPGQPRRMIVSRQVCRLPEARADEFHDRLQALLQEFDAADTEDRSQLAYALAVTFYPSFYFQDDDSAAGHLPAGP